MEALWGEEKNQEFNCLIHELHVKSYLRGDGNDLISLMSKEPLIVSY